jgi:hypothetical protein
MKKLSSMKRPFHFGRHAPLSALIAVLFFLFSAAPSAAQGSSLSLSPAVIMAKGAFGQSLTQRLTINNQTPNTFNFVMVAQDIVVRDGKRVFLPAGEMDNSIAATAVFSPKEVVAAPFSSGSVDVTVTLPQNTSLRAIAAVFRTKNVMNPTTGNVGLTASMGTLITFNVSANVALTSEPVHVNLPTESTNLSFDQTLTNTGSEPIIPKGVAAILNSKGQLAGKASFAIQRLLPGEKLVYHAEYPDQLPAGSYRVACTFQFEGKTENQQADFTVP